MTRILALTLLIAASGCTSTYKTTFDHDQYEAPVKIHVAPVLDQEELGVQVVVADSSAATAQFGLIGALVGAAIDSAVNSSRAKKAERRAEVLREAMVGYDLMAGLQKTMESVDEHSRWQVVQLDSPVATTETRDLVAGIFDTSDVDAVIVMHGNYELTPELTQVKASLLQNVYGRSEYVEGKRPRSNGVRSITYLSPYKPLSYRVYRDGEKAQIVDAIETEYMTQIETLPDQSKKLETAMKKELKEIEESNLVPEHVAIGETWPKDELTRYLQQSIDHLSYMVTLDWADNTVPEDPKERTKDRFNAVNSMGVNALQKGRQIGTRDDNIIYRDQSGALYSVPANVE